MKRTRRTKAQMSQLRTQIRAVLAEDHPQSVRHVFYRMTDPTLPEAVEKSERGYGTIQRLLVAMRRDGEVEYGWITDATRRGYFVQTHNSVADAVADAARYYRRNVWRDNPVYVEVWCESRSIAGVIQPVTEDHAVPLYPAGGFTSLTLAYQAAEHMEIVADGRPAHVLYIGDHDAAGRLIDPQVEREFRQHLPDQFSLTFHRIAITSEQISLMGLPTKPSKDTRGGFKGRTVEAEAMPAGTLRSLLSEAIEGFLDPRVRDVIEAAEASERRTLAELAHEMRGAA